MKTRKVKDAIDLENGELIYFKGHAKATYMSDGRNVEDAINSVGSGGGGADLNGYVTEGELEQGLATKQDVISDLAVIREGASKGATALQSYTEKYTGTYNKPSSGIPITDLTDAIQESLRKADTALQQHQDISGKQDTIHDIETIRQGASKGATALQSVPSEYVTEAELSSKGYATTESVTESLATKQDTISDLATIRSGAAKGATALQSHQDISGKLDKTEAASTYLTKTDASSTYLGKTDKASDATKADSATKATQDASGNVITSTYATKTELSDKGTYSKPSTGIPKTDLASGVQTSLGKADTALQEERFKGTVVAENAASALDDPLINSFEVLPTGNIKVTYNGVSNEFMEATPSGDPMHYTYTAVGAEYNDTGEDVARTGAYGDIITWKSGCWYLNDLGDITNDEMRNIYIFANITNAAKTVGKMMEGVWTRTNIATWSGTWNEKIVDSQLFGYCTGIKTVRFRSGNIHYLNSNVSWLFVSCVSLEKIFPTLNATSTTSFNGAFDACTELKEVRLEALKVNCSFVRSYNLSNASILYMINKEAATSAFTITLHPDAYARAMADEAIVAALESHPNVTLSK